MIVNTRFLYELFDSCVSSAFCINKIKLNCAVKSKFYLSFFSTKNAFGKKLCRLVINDFGNTNKLNWELRIKGG